MENNYPIPRNVLDGYDIAGLMNKMAKADWYYDYSEDSAVWNRGLLEIKGIKEDLAQLSKMENGVMAANYLWDAYVPAHSVSKPDFLQLTDDLEVQLKSFDWTNAFYDPLHDTIEASTSEEKDDLSNMEALLAGLQERYHSGPSGKAKVEQLVLTYWKDTPMEQQIDQLLNSKSGFVMNDKNYEYLSKQILFTGFGEGHQEELKAKMQEGKPDFVLFHQQDFGKDNVVATLQFNKPEDGERYFFNRYNLLLKTGLDADPIKQTFYINNDMKKKEHEDITLKEGYNLLSGRAVNKNLVSQKGETYNAWVQLDFKTTDKHGNFEEKKFHEKYGFDLPVVVAKLPIKELQDVTQTERLLESLQRGNRQSVTLQLPDNRETKIFIEASPQFKSLNLYDSTMKRTNIQTLSEGQKEGQSEKQGAKQSQGPASDGEDGGPGPKENKKRRRQSQGL